MIICIFFQKVLLLILSEWTIAKSAECLREWASLADCCPKTEKTTECPESLNMLVKILASSYDERFNILNQTTTGYVSFLMLISCHWVLHQDDLRFLIKPSFLITIMPDFVKEKWKTITDGFFAYKTD